MAQPQLLQVKLSRFDAQPWGFRLQGGVDFATPLVVQKVNGGSLAEKAGLIPGDAVLKINDVDVFNLRHKDAQDVVVRSGNNFVLTVQRGGSTWRPHVTPTGNIPQPQHNSSYLQAVTKTSLAHKQQESQHIGCGYNNAARPFANGGDGNVKSIVNKQYNTPVGIYSDESIAETLSAQAEVLAGGVLGVNFKKNEKEYQADKSEVLKFLREEETGASTPEPPAPANFYSTQSHAIGGNERRTPLSYNHQQPAQQEQPQIEAVATKLQENDLVSNAPQRPNLTSSAKPSTSEPADPRVIIMPVCPALQGPEYKAEMEAAAAALQHVNGPRPLSASGHPACALCGVGIVGVFVRIKDKNLHVECFKCATCGTSLKNQGYYNYNNKLYCDIHAKLAALQNPPAGTDGYVPVPIKPNTKLSANTISSALNVHGFSNIPVANGGSAAALPSAPQVEKPAATAALPPQASPAPASIAQATTAISSTIAINNQNLSNNNSESGQFEGATQGIHEKATVFPSAMLANLSPAQGTGSDDQPFGEYVTLTGSVIRSVVPPGKGANINYKVNQGYARPFGAAPAAAPKSPVTYPPQRPAVNPYATLPRTNIGQQDSDASLQPQYAEECNSKSAPVGVEYFEEDHELAEVNRQNRCNFLWPPQKEGSPVIPTAAPLYIPPPETQHIVAKAPKVSHLQMEDKVTNKQSLNEPEIKESEPEQQVKQYLQSNRQSKSAPHITIGLQPPEIESSSESFTSTSTTTTTTSEEYQRMYAAQLQAYQMQQMYEQQSGSELDYHMDMEVATMQQNPQDSSCISSSEYICGRRSAQDCVESLVAPLNTYKLIDMVREVTPSPVPPTNLQGNRHVMFMDEPDTKEIPIVDDEENINSQVLASSDAISSSSMFTSSSLERSLQENECVVNNMKTFEENRINSETLVKIQHTEVREDQRIFQPASEIKIEIAPVRQIPPSKIPNTVPKEWINPMVRVLTTAPDMPFHLVECPCPKPCDGNPFEPLEEVETPQENVKTEDTKNNVHTKKILSVEETPAKGSWFASAITTAPEWEVRFQSPPSEMIPLPEETEPYMPPPIDMKPYMREDYRPKSPFLSALTTAPERSFEGHFERDVPIHLLDLPTPKEHLTLSDALCTAPERAYTPLNPENATNVFEEQEMEKKKKKSEFQVLNREEELGIQALDSKSIEYYTTENRDYSQHRKSSAFAAMQAFQPTQEPLISKTSRQSITSCTKEEFDPDYEGYYKAKERNKKRIDYLHKKEEELQQQHIEPISKQKISENNTCQMSSLNSYTKRNSSSESSSAVQAMSNTTSTSSYDLDSTHASRSSYQNAARSVKSETKIDLHEVIEETTEELEHSEVLFPPPSPLSHLHVKSVPSGLHKADSIPKYQRNWTVLPTQSPARTPEPPELRENVPLAFVDAPVTTSSSNPVHKPVAQNFTTTAVSQRHQQQHEEITSANRGSIISTSSNTSFTQEQSKSKLLTPNKKPIIPIIIEEKIAPQVTMAFQSLDEHLQTEESQTPSRPYTPSIGSKPVPVIPYYQTPEALCFDECPATHARNYDRRSASPFPDRARSPAPGPPPNPLAAIRSSKPKDNELSSLSPRVLQAGSITTGQSYLGAQQQLQQQHHQAQILSHNEQTISTGHQSCIDKPEKVEVREIGDYRVQSTEKEVHKVNQKHSKLDSQTKIQLGDTQIERRRRVTEEYEHTQSARSVEIRTDSKTTKSIPAISESERRQSYGKTGYVANQARRLSGLEQEITNLTSQSQAISARAATLTETSFPQIKSPEPSSKFPTKPVLPPHDEPQRPNYFLSATPYNKMVGPPPGFKEQQQQSTTYGSSVVSQQQQSLNTYSSSKTSSLSSQAIAANVGNLTKASITNINKAGAASARTNGASAICPVTGTFCRPGHTCCRQQQLLGQSTATDVANYNQSNNLTYRTNASTGLTDIKTNTQATAIAATSAVNTIDTATSQVQSTATAAAAAATATTSFPPPNIIDKNKSNAGLDGSTGVGGKAAFGATSAPKRGRGIFNKAVAPGVRVPLCSSCNIQIRGPFITALGRIWCPEHFICVNVNCRRPLQDIGFVEEKGDLYCEYCFEKYLAPTCCKCGIKIKGDCLNAIGKQFHPECFTCGHCGKLFGNTPFFLEDGNAYCEADWNELFTTKCFACGFPVEAGDRWVEALNHNYHSQCFNCTYCKKNLEGQSFYNKGGRPFCKNHAR